MCFFFSSFVLPLRAACGILISLSGIEPAPQTLEAWSLNHWPTREVPGLCFNSHFYCVLLFDIKTTYNYNKLEFFNI